MTVEAEDFRWMFEYLVYSTCGGLALQLVEGRSRVIYRLGKCLGHEVELPGLQRPRRTPGGVARLPQRRRS
jgi:hypothetical protein